MSAVISLRASAADAIVIEHVAAELGRAAMRGEDGTWELVFGGTYGDAHAQVLDALNTVDPAWPARVTIEYALAV